MCVLQCWWIWCLGKFVARLRNNITLCWCDGRLVASLDPWTSVLFRRVHHKHNTSTRETPSYSFSKHAYPISNKDDISSFKMPRPNWVVSGMVLFLWIFSLLPLYLIQKYYVHTQSHWFRWVLCGYYNMTFCDMLIRSPDVGNRANVKGVLVDYYIPALGFQGKPQKQVLGLSWIMFIVLSCVETLLPFVIVGRLSAWRVACVCQVWVVNLDNEGCFKGLGFSRCARDVALSLSKFKKIIITQNKNKVY